jgi:hypothetical protein
MAVSVSKIAVCFGYLTENTRLPSLWRYFIESFDLYLLL